MPVLNDKMAGHQAAWGQVSVNSAFTWSLLLYNAYQFCSSNGWVLQHHSVRALDMSTITLFVHLGLQCKWGQLSSNNSLHTSHIHKGLNAGKWTDLMAPKPVAVSTLNTTGQTILEPHWLMLSLRVFQWQSRAPHLHIWNTLDDQWSHKYTGMPLEPHLLMLAPNGVPMAIQYKFA